MDNGVPRFNPVSHWDWSHLPADVDTPTESFDPSAGSEFDGDSGMVARTLHSSYRLRVAYLSGACFAIGTGFTIYNLALGR